MLTSSRMASAQGAGRDINCNSSVKKAKGCADKVCNSIGIVCGECRRSAKRASQRVAQIHVKTKSKNI